VSPLGGVNRLGVRFFFLLFSCCAVGGGGDLWRLGCAARCSPRDSRAGPGSTKASQAAHVALFVGSSSFIADVAITESGPAWSGRPSGQSRAARSRNLGRLCVAEGGAYQAGRGGFPCRSPFHSPLRAANPAGPPPFIPRPSWTGLPAPKSAEAQKPSR